MSIRKSHLSLPGILHVKAQALKTQSVVEQHMAAAVCGSSSVSAQSSTSLPEALNSLANVAAHQEKEDCSHMPDNCLIILH